MTCLIHSRNNPSCLWCSPRQVFWALTLCACNGFELPSDTIDAVAEYAVLQTLPKPGERPESFACTVDTPLGALTVIGDEPGVTLFALEGSEPETIEHEGPALGRLVDGTRVVVVGDLLIVGGRWVRLGECEGE